LNVDVVSIVGLSVVSGIFAYAAFWSFNIRTGLAVPLYRNQAAGLGLVILEAGFISLYVLFFPNNQLFIPIVWIVDFGIFYWINASMLAARRTDPLLRDTFHWRKLRFVILSLAALGIIATTGFLFLTDNFGAGIVNYNPNAPSFYLTLLFSPAFFIFIPAGVVLAIAAFRSGDLAFRRHLLWFGLFAIISLGPEILGIFTADRETHIIIVAIFAPVYGYCLYRSARALVPLNKIPSME
jgi:hypothetical protein